MAAVPAGAANFLARFLGHRRLQGTVVELGAGVGLPGLTAACAGADVVLTERGPSKLDLLRLNCEENAKRIGACGGSARVEELVWGCGDDLGGGATADYVVGADLSYDADSIAPLVRTIVRLKERAATRRDGDSGGGCTALLAVDVRRSAACNLMLQSELAAGGLVVDTVVVEDNLEVWRAC